MATSKPAQDALWRNLADALNALCAAGQHPDFHDLYGARNGWRRQPFTSSTSANAPWVVFDLSTRQYVVTSRERTVSGEYPRRKRR
ncbi:hypothetical protein ACWD4N_46780 [Streptomyces sp. NPDC002586]